jgi:hypothetical protein
MFFFIKVTVFKLQKALPTKIFNNHYYIGLNVEGHCLNFFRGLMKKVFSWARAA